MLPQSLSLAESYTMDSEFRHGVAQKRPMNHDICVDPTKIEHGLHLFIIMKIADINAFIVDYIKSLCP
jgi:hypothetical protein